MNLDRFFRLVSYSAAFCGMFALAATGGISILVALFFSFGILIASRLDETRFQLSEKLGTVFVFCCLPIFFLDWRYGLLGFFEQGAGAPGSLAKLILFLAVIKFFQRKADRDWIFIYLISFFQILLAAGLSISPMFFVSLIAYLFFAVCAIVTFEMRRTANAVNRQNTRDGSAISHTTSETLPLRSLPIFATVSLLAITLVAMPLFFALPRVGGAGLGKNLGGGANLTGFSDTVRLGDIAKIQRNEEIVFRARLTGDENLSRDEILWRGVALDFFDGRSWSRKRFRGKQEIIANENNTFSLGTNLPPRKRVTQTIYLEPITSEVLFALSQPLAVRGNFNFLMRDQEGSLSRNPVSDDRISYTVLSETATPNAEKFRQDYANHEGAFDRYREVPPDTDQRIAELAGQILAESRAENRFDYAKAVEEFLRRNYGYTLDLKITGDQPVADFLFNVREGHCEYFASAMALILRTQGIATRVVNGFRSGDFNETAGVYVVRQSDAHSWVEVYFPGEKSWIPFDPTPAASGEMSAGGSTIAQKMNSYLVALETFWIQYFVTFDNYEQRSLFRSIRKNAFDLQSSVSTILKDVKSNLLFWWSQVRGDEGYQMSFAAILRAAIYIVALALIIMVGRFLFYKAKRLKIFESLLEFFRVRQRQNIVEFYERMERALARRGFTRAPHQTPLEFACATNVREAVSITENYNRVRFGEKSLSESERTEIENWLRSLESEKKKV